MKGFSSRYQNVNNHGDARIMTERLPDATMVEQIAIATRISKDNGYTMIALADYARRHGRLPESARQMAMRGGFRTARKLGRDWVIDSGEPYPDHRRHDGGGA